MKKGIKYEFKNDKIKINLVNPKKTAKFRTASERGGGVCGKTKILTEMKGGGR